MSVSSLATDRTVDDADVGTAAQPGQPARPSYGPVLAVYLAFVGAVALTVRAVTGGRPPQPSAGDLVMIGAAVFKVSRIVTEEKVLQPVREPFVSEETTTPQPVAENTRPRRTAGVRRAIGELLTCPFCLSVWIATAFTGLFAMAPRVARLVSGGLTTVVISDVGQCLYTKLRNSVD